MILNGDHLRLISTVKNGSRNLELKSFIIVAYTHSVIVTDISILIMLSILQKKWGGSAKRIILKN